MRPVRTGVRTVVELTAYPDGHANIAVGDLDMSVRGAPAYSRKDTLPLNHRAELEQVLQAVLDRLFDAAAGDPEADDHPTAVPSAISITLTDGNLNNNHFYLRSHLSFFPADAVGAANAADGTGTPLTIHLAGAAEPVETDIAGGNKSFLRSRGPVGAFFRRHGLRAGDEIRVERVSEREYRVTPAR